MKATDAILDSLRKRGERLTIQRRVVIEALAAGDDHQTIVELQQAIEQRGLVLDAATVYRILEHLNTIGVVSHTDIGTRGIVYELITDIPHHHIVCLSCGKVQHLDDRLMSTVRECLQQEFAFQPRIEHMALFGYCHNCQQKA